MTSWLGHAGDSVLEVGLLGRDVTLTAELLKVSAFLAAFSGLYFTVVLVTDATYREEFFDEILAELRTPFAVRTVYLAARRERTGGGPATPQPPLRPTQPRAAGRPARAPAGGGRR